MLALDAATLRRGGRTVLDAASLAVVPGRVTALVGPNGAGKTSALHLLAGDLAPDGGQAQLDGQPLIAVAPGERARRRAVMPQRFDLAFAFTAREVVAMGVLDAVPPAHRARLIAEALERADIAHLAERLVTRLSGGERQRVALARALAQVDSGAYGVDADHEPPAGRYLLLDEPTASLDLAHQDAVMRTARQLAAEGVGVLAVLHDLNLAAAIADELVMLSDGRVHAIGPPADILTAEVIAAVYGVSVRLLGDEAAPVVALTP